VIYTSTLTIPELIWVFVYQYKSNRKEDHDIIFIIKAFQILINFLKKVIKDNQKIIDVKNVPIIFLI